MLGLTDPKFIGDTQVTVEGGGVYTLPISVAVDPINLEEGTQKIYFKVTTSVNGEIVESIEPSTFIFTGV